MSKVNYPITLSPETVANYLANLAKQIAPSHDIQTRVIITDGPDGQPPNSIMYDGTDDTCNVFLYYAPHRDVQAGNQIGSPFGHEGEL